MGKTSLITCVAALGALFILWQWVPTDSEKVTGLKEPEKSQQSEPDAERSSAPPDDRSLQSSADEGNRFGLSEEEVVHIKRRYQYEQAAEQRFAQTADMDGLRPESVSTEVRKLFQTLRLEPEFDLEEGQQGYVDGMRVARMASDNPLAQAGFQVGDRLTRINGEALRDPATIAHLVTRIGPAMEVCAMRAGVQLCHQVTLVPPAGG